MNRLTTGTTVLALAFCGTLSTAMAAEYQVTVTNLTSGLYFTPIIASAHGANVAMFRSGSAASPELQAIAEGGDIAPMAALLDSVGASVATGEGLVAPGQTVTLTLQDSGNEQNSLLSVASMLLPTNDGFLGLNSVSLPAQNGPASRTWDVNGYDAGTEANDELVGSGAPGEAGFPAPPPVVATGTGRGGHGIPSQAEGFVHIHRNVIGDLEPEGGASDINAAVHRWLNPVARVTVTRMGNGNADGSVPGAIAGLQGIAYSSSSIEIFWDRATSPGSLVTSYEIYRNGILLDTRDALSYFDEALGAGIEYRYEVKAVDANGVRGPSAQVVVTTFP